MWIRSLLVAIAAVGVIACSHEDGRESVGESATTPATQPLGPPERNSDAPKPPPDLGAIAEKWVRRSDYLVDTRREKPLPKVSAAPVARESVDAAIELLTSREWCIVRHADAEKYAGVPIHRSEGGVDVLLRGVESLRELEDSVFGNDDFKVYYKDGAVRVETRGARFGDRDYRPRPVVAYLPAEPIELFVDPLYTIAMHSFPEPTNDLPEGR